MRERKSIDESKIYSKQQSNPDLLNYKPNTILTKEEHENLVSKIMEAQSQQSKKRQ